MISDVAKTRIPKKEYASPKLIEHASDKANAFLHEQEARGNEEGQGAFEFAQTRSQLGKFV
jgi:hypothetical protein